MLELPIHIGSRYNGICLVMDRPRRYEASNNRYLSEPARSFVLREALGMQDTQIAICSLDQMSRVPRKKVVIYCGPGCVFAAAQKNRWGAVPHLDNVRGHAIEENGIRTIFTYNPSDAMDRGPVDDDEAEEGDSYGGTEKDGGKTRWSNFRTWFLLDIKKVLAKTIQPPLPFKRIYPSQPDLIAWLGRPRKYLYLDVENNPKDCTLWCIGVMDDNDDRTVISIPIYDYTYSTPLNAPKILCALVRAMHRCRVVCHNANYDLAFLFMKYAFPISFEIEDTMLMHHRCFPELEKSLGHCGSLWTNNPYHKDSGGTWFPKNLQQYQQLLTYNAADVVLTRGVHEAITARGPRSSIVRVNRIAGEYLRMGLTGLVINVPKQLAMRRVLVKRLVQYNRILHILVGYPLAVSSSQKLAKYFYNEMRYTVNATTESGAPATDAKTLYSLLVTYENPAIVVILAIKKAEKALSMLHFKRAERTETCFLK